MIRFSTGDTVPIVSGAARGFVDTASIEGRSLTAGGWAMPPDRVDTVDRVMAFSGDRLVATGHIRLRPDLGEQYGKKALAAGFQVQAKLQPGKAGRIRVFAEEAGRASELERAR